MNTPEDVFESLEPRRSERPFFDEGALPEVPLEYVCWLDLMGAQSAIRRSHRIAANFVMKVHVAALAASGRSAMDVYPVVDGMYICSPDLPHMLTYVKNVMTKLALTFIFEDRPDHRFLVRGALAYGPVIKGRTSHAASNALRDNAIYSNQVLLGIPLVQSYGDEPMASPFGIYVHESARSFAPIGGWPLPVTHWKWWTWYETPDDLVLAKGLKATLTEHLDWCTKHCTTIMYARDRIDQHQALFEEYFADV